MTNRSHDEIKNEPIHVGEFSPDEPPGDDMQSTELPRDLLSRIVKAAGGAEQPSVLLGGGLPTDVSKFTWAQQEHFGLYIRALRQEAGLSLRTAAVKLGVSYSYIAKLENGNKDHAPSLKVMKRIASIYQRNIGEVMGAAGIWFFDSPHSEESREVIRIPTEDTEVIFQRLIEHESLTPENMASSELAFIPTIIKKRWISFAHKLQEAVLNDELRVDDVISGKNTGKRT